MMAVMKIENMRECDHLGDCFDAEGIGSCIEIRDVSVTVCYRIQ